MQSIQNEKISRGENKKKEIDCKKRKMAETLKVYKVTIINIKAYM